MRKPSIALLLTNHNTWELAARCATECVRLDAGRFNSLMIYDDCSSSAMNVKLPQEARLHIGSINLGLTKSLNAAVQLLDEDVIVLFDSDAYPISAFCEEVRSRFATDECLGLLAFHTVGREGRPTESFTTEPNAWSLVAGQALYARYEQLLKDRSGRLSVFTCAMAFRRQAFCELNGFDEHFDWLDLDHDFSMRMNRSRWNVGVAASARMFHEGGGTPQSTAKRVMRFYKTRWYLLGKFNRLPFRCILKGVIICRLAVEFVILSIMQLGSLRQRPQLREKRESRARLIGYCLREY